MKKNRPVRRALHGCAFAGLFAAAVFAAPACADEQSDRIESLEKRLERSLKLIEQLESRVRELEGQRPAPAVAAASAPAAGASAPAWGSGPPSATAVSDQVRKHTEAIGALQDEVNQLSEGLSKASADTGLPLHGFADVDAGTSSSADPRRLRGFSAGTLDLYLVPQFGERVRSLIEVAFEYESSGELTADVERLQLGYTLSDDLTVWMGRFHTPFGLWNTWFHHGANLQTSIYRPRFIEFEDKGGIIPAHSVGLWASGRFGIGSDRITYDAYLANGPSVRHRQLDFNPVTDDDHNKMVGFNVGYHPSGNLRGLSVGVHGFASRASEFAGDDSVIGRTRLRMGGAYAGYDARDWEIIAEYYRFANTDLASGRRRNSSAWFAQAGRTVGAWTPYLRYERTALDEGDAYFASQDLGRSYRRVVLGTRYALDSRSSFKAELSSTREDAMLQLDESGLGVLFPRTSYRRASFQYSIAF